MKRKCNNGISHEQLAWKRKTQNEIETLRVDLLYWKIYQKGSIKDQKGTKR